MMKALGKLFLWAREMSGIFKILFFIVLALVVVLNFFLLPHHPHIGLEKIPGFWAVFGLGAAVIMILFVKKYLAYLVGMPEDYYERSDD